MLPPDQHKRFDQPDRPDDVAEPGSDYPTPTPTDTLPPYPWQPYYGSQDEQPLPLPYDDGDPTQQMTPTYPPPASPVPSPDRTIVVVPGSPPYAPPPNQPYPPYQPHQPPAPSPQIVYVRERRPSLCSISCSILSILLLMTCSLVGLGIFQGVATALQTAGKTLPARITVAFFCAYETTQQYTGAYEQFSTRLQQQISESAFAEQSQQLDQQYGQVTDCQRSSTSSDATSANQVSIQVDVTRSGNQTVSQGTVVVVQQGSDWRIDQIASVLDLLPAQTTDSWLRPLVNDSVKRGRPQAGGDSSAGRDKQSVRRL